VQSVRSSETSLPCPILRNPKRDKLSRLGRSGWYQYYAGFSSNFVQDALTISGATAGEDVVLDPWNGSGTTTDIAARNGFDSIGLDLNPVMVLVSKARTLQSNVQPSIESILEELLLRARTVDSGLDQEPLMKWLAADTASFVRSVETALQTILIDPKSYCSLGSLDSLQNVSSLAAFFYVLLFKTLKEILTPFRSSNPTWIKNAITPKDRLRVPRKQLISVIRAQAVQMSRQLILDDLPTRTGRIPNTHLDIASSLLLPLKNNSVGLILTSPPYCTRIDYVIKTAPELALLGVGDPAAVHELRRRMIGTPTIDETLPSPRKAWGKTCLDLVNKISKHKSHASKSYYLKTHLQYFDGLYKSLVEIDRILVQSGECFFVVQDSYYKEAHVDLARILREMGHSIGWECGLRRDFSSSRTMVGLNRGARAYDNPKRAVESVLHFTKG
jgi:hypothetical protein